MVTVSDLCLTYVMSFNINLCVGGFGLQTIFNDSYLVQLYIIFNQSDGRVVNSPLILYYYY